MLVKLAISTVILMKLFAPTSALAATCYVLDDNGTKWHKNLANAKGVYPNSLYTVTASKKCPDSGGFYKEPEAVEIPPLPVQEYVGMEKIFINPTYTAPNTCIYMKTKFVQKLEDGSYQITSSVHDASQTINGITSCPYK